MLWCLVNRSAWAQIAQLSFSLKHSNTNLGRGWGASQAGMRGHEHTTRLGKKPSLPLTLLGWTYWVTSFFYKTGHLWLRHEAKGVQILEGDTKFQEISLCLSSKASTKDSKTHLLRAPPPTTAATTKCTSFPVTMFWQDGEPSCTSFKRQDTEQFDFK